MPASDIEEGQYSVEKALKLPDVYLDYQKRLMNFTSLHPVVICEKSRRIGVTWAIAADAVLTASKNKESKGMNVFYIGFNLDMTKEFIDTAAEWAKAFSQITIDVEEFIFKDQDKDGADKNIQAFRIRFDSGFSIVALTSRPRSLRGRQGYIIIDEAAFHDDLDELMKAALAMLIWGGKVLVISTHDGVDNPFNQMILDSKSGRNQYKVLRIDLDDALKDGLYKRICFMAGDEWSQAKQIAWRKEIVNFYQSGADEELFCIPRRSSGAFLSGALVESRMVGDVPVIAYKSPEGLVDMPEYLRKEIVLDWCEEHLKPYLDELDPKLQSYLGEDFGRSGDLTCLHPVQVSKNLIRKTPFTVELRAMPFAAQRQILFYILDRLPRLSGVALDARGNGQQIAEETRQEYGAGIVHEIMTGPAFYADAFPRYKTALEDGTFTLPRHADVLADHRIPVVQNGQPMIPKIRTKGKDDGGQRHGDSFIAAALVNWVTYQDATEFGYDTPTNPNNNDFDDDFDDDNSSNIFGSGAY